jgi:hypothetical protein
MDRYSVSAVRIFKAENDGWVAVDGDHRGQPPHITYGAFTSKADLLAWLTYHLYEMVEGEKSEVTNDK